MQKFGITNAMTKESSLDGVLKIFKELLIPSYTKNVKIPWKGGHDEGTYLTAYREYYLHTHDLKVTEYTSAMLRQAVQWTQANFLHGYYPYHEVHHGIENFVIFFAWLYELDPGNASIHQILKNAANNIVHPPNNLTWFDFQKNRFTSDYLGTEKIDPTMKLNIPEHFRMIRLAWLGTACGGDSQLKTVILNYMREWAQLISDSTEIPIFLPEKTGAAITEEDRRNFQLALQKFIGAAPKVITNKTRSEYHIANGAPDLFIALYEATKDPLYLDAVEKLLLPVIDQLKNPFAHPLGELVWHVHQLGRLRNFKESIQTIQADVDAMLNKPFTLNFKKFGADYGKIYQNSIGFRKDMPDVEIISGKNRYLIPSPSTLGLLYRVTGSEKYLTFGLEYARAILLEAKKKYPEGRGHGCSSQKFHSFCIGHGRNWGAGYASTILRAACSKDCYNITLPKISLE